ncbi:response regulator [uncultured Roseobacter sp.]|uniref:response regulator transcription factor n=1 Tax=uncultured Roseobacter sp. TaxID=114847 RepID=UPI00261AA0BE|nr:response regulator [uncultured Roseobacter sp.]
MQSESEQKVFVVDDDEDIRTSLSRALKTRGYATRTFGSAHEFLDAYDPELSGCLILDYGMPEMSGLDLQRALVARGASLPIIFITGHGGVPESVQAMKLGAVDFLEKPFRQEVLIKQIDAALKLDAQARQGRNRARDARRRFENLTEREREIAELLVSNPSSSSSKDVARQLDISPRTVDHHRARILEKMRVNSVAELVDLSITTHLFEKS